MMAHVDSSSVHYNHASHPRQLKALHVYNTAQEPLHRDVPMKDLRSQVADRDVQTLCRRIHDQPRRPHPSRPFDTPSSFSAQSKS